MTKTTSAQSIQAQSFTINIISIFDIYSLHLPIAHVSNPLSESIHINPLITTIKKYKTISLLFNVGLNICNKSSY